MRALYAERQAVLVDAAARELRGLLEVREAEAGMHLMGWLPSGADDEAASARAAAHGVFAPPVSPLYVGPPGSPGLLLGYAAVTAGEIRQGARQLARAGLKDEGRKLTTDDGLNHKDTKGTKKPRR